MKFNFVTKDITKVKTDCIILGVYENSELTESGKVLNKISKNYFTNLLTKDEFSAQIGQSLLLYNVPDLSVKRVLLVGCGKKEPLSIRNYRKIINTSIQALKSSNITQTIITLTELEVEKQNSAWKVKQATEVTESAWYYFDQYKSKKVPPRKLKEISWTIPAKALKSCQQALSQALAVNTGMNFVKDLANTPPNICTPTYLADQAKKLAKQYKTLSVKILEESDMKKLGMNAFLSVTQGSTQPAKLICIEYKGPRARKKQAPIAFVGKGITFDTGGISLKPSDSMAGMKFDMCGAATVLGVIKAAAQMELPAHLIGILAAAENMPSGNASKPEDIVTSLSGQTIEIMNTDAEGRLVLCDALTYVERYKPEIVIDIATLTYAVVVAFGIHATGLMANNDALADDLIEAGIESHDRVWLMPLWEEYQELLNSPFADMSNVGGRMSGMITSGCFLSRFTKKFRWAHLDIAGTATMMGASDRNATGRPIPLLMQFLFNKFCKG